VDAISPVLKLQAARLQSASKQKAVTMKVGSNEPATVTTAASLALPAAGKSTKVKRYRLKRVSKPIVAGQTATIKLPLSATLRKAIAAALRRGAPKVSILVTATDAAGNKTTRTAVVRLKR
jgi:hypothetical protein